MLDRPKLDELRDLVRAGSIDIFVIYCLDRLTRDPNHGVILAEELEKYHVILEAVSETVDNSELGQLYDLVIVNLQNCTSEVKRQALDALDIEVYASTERVEIRGVIPLELPTTEQTSA